MSIPETTRPANSEPPPILAAPAGSGSLNGHGGTGTSGSPPAGDVTARPAIADAAPMDDPPAGHETSRDHRMSDTQARAVPADSIPAGQRETDPHACGACGDEPPPAATLIATPTGTPLLAEYEYHLLGMAAKEVDDLESARVAAENRLRQIIRTVADKDGGKRGFGLLPPGVCAEDDKKAVEKVIKAAREYKRAPARWHPAVWQLATVAGQITDAEKTAIRHLEKQVAALPLGPWVKSVCGLGFKQAGRLLGAISDPYIRPLIEHDDAPAEPARHRALSELYSYCGHGDPARKPVKGMTQAEAKRLGNPEAKKRVRVIAMQFVKFTGEGNPRSPYRDVYDKTREQYATAVHAAECLNRSRVSPNGCGIRQHPEWGAPGSPWRDGHQHANALRLTGKAFLADLWTEAKRLHETCASGQGETDTHGVCAAGAQGIPGSAA